MGIGARMQRSGGAELPSPSTSADSSGIYRHHRDDGGAEAGLTTKVSASVGDGLAR